MVMIIGRFVLVVLCMFVGLSVNWLVWWIRVRYFVMNELMVDRIIGWWLRCLSIFGVCLISLRWC